MHNPGSVCNAEWVIYVNRGIRFGFFLFPEFAVVFQNRFGIKYILLFDSCLIRVKEMTIRSLPQQPLFL